MSAVSDASPLLPVRPHDPVDVDEADGVDHAFEHPEDADVEVAKGDDRIDTDELVCGPCADDESIVKPQLFPSRRLRALPRLNSTTPYRIWCPWCIAGRHNNSPHRELGDKHGRSEPCLHLDYALLSDEVGSDLLTVLIGKLEHPKSKLEKQSSTFACPAGEKGANDAFVHVQLKNFIRMHGVRHLIFKSNQERSSIAVIEAVASGLRKEGIFMIVEQSPVGESQSNGVGERQVQAVEDLVRTMR